jgi:hypothetical protein
MITVPFHPRITLKIKSREIEPPHNEVKGEGLINFEATANISRQRNLEFINRNPCPSLKFVSMSCLFHASWYTIHSPLGDGVFMIS